MAEPKTPLEAGDRLARKGGANLQRERSGPSSWTRSVPEAEFQSVARVLTGITASSSPCLLRLSGERPSLVCHEGRIVPCAGMVAVADIAGYIRQGRSAGKGRKRLLG